MNIEETQVPKKEPAFKDLKKLLVYLTKWIDLPKYMRIEALFQGNKNPTSEP